MIRKEYQLTEEQFTRLHKSKEPDRVWKDMGEAQGFKYLTVRPHPTLGTRFFTAEIDYCE